MVAADNRVSLANPCEYQKFVVFWVAAGGFDAHLIGLRHREKAGVLTN